MVIVGVLVVCCIPLYVFLLKSTNVKLEKIGECFSEKKLSGTWWFPIYSQNDEMLKVHGIELPEVDFNANNLVIAGGREIKKMNFILGETSIFKKSHFVKVLFGKELHPDTWFIYKIDKIEVYRNPFMEDTNTDIKIED